MVATFRCLRASLAAGCLALTAGVSQRPRAGLSQRPHVLFVVIDDLGFTDVGFRSHDIRTPTVDSLAKNGVVLDQYYVPSVCSPSRATFMTGRFPMHHGIVDRITPTGTYGLPLNETTMADKFKEAGYATHAVGKWHLGFYRKEMTPTFRGFDSFYGFYTGEGDYFTHVKDGHYDFRRDPSPRCGPGCSQVASEAAGRYSTTLFSEEAVRIVSAHPEGASLFLYLAYQAVHGPAEVPQEYMDAYKATIADPMRRKFAGMLSCMDEGLANVTAALQARGWMDSTLVVFTTDNGASTGGDGIGGRNWPLRGGKYSIWEGGTRGTAFISGKMLKKTGSTFTHLMHGADWLPTLGAVAGFDVSTIPLPLDGVSQWDAINGAKGQPARTGFVYGNSADNCKRTSPVFEVQVLANAEVQLLANGPDPCGFAIRDRQWKLTLGDGGAPDTWCNKSSSGLICMDVVPSTGSSTLPACLDTGFCLWDVVNDPYEYTEVSAKHPDVVARLKVKMGTILQNYHQFQLDPACGAPTFEHDEKVGPAWTPWCDSGKSISRHSL